MKPSQHILTGRKGEEEACLYLEKKGYKIKSRNFRKKNHGDIDIVAMDKDTYIFVEVKTRTGDIFGAGEESINRYKLRNLIKSVYLYCQAENISDTPLRIDVITVSLSGNVPEISHYENITGM